MLHPLPTSHKNKFLSSHHEMRCHFKMRFQWNSLGRMKIKNKRGEIACCNEMTCFSSTLNSINSISCYVCNAPLSRDFVIQTLNFRRKCYILKTFFHDSIYFFLAVEDNFISFTSILPFFKIWLVSNSRNYLWIYKHFGAMF